MFDPLQESRTSPNGREQATLFRLVVFFSLFVAGLVQGYVIRNQEKDVIDIVKGRFYLITDNNGGHRRLNKRDILKVSGSQKVRLELGSLHDSLEMSLSQYSVWTPDSRVFERNDTDQEAVETDVKIDSDCFLGGHLLSHEGVASFIHCNGLRGFVQTSEVEYLLEQTSDSDSQYLTDSEYPEVKVTLVRSDNGSFDDNFEFPVASAEDGGLDNEDEEIEDEKDEDEEDEDEKDEDEEDEDEKDEDDENENDEDEDLDHNFMMEEDDLFFNQTDRANQTADIVHSVKKRADLRPIAAEVAIYLTEGFVDFLRKRGVDNRQKITEFMIIKWNAVARVYGDVQKVGVPFDIQLKKVVVWTKNPAFYVPVQANHKLRKHIRRFCRKTKKQRADHRMLYIVGVGGRMLGLAGTYKLCNARRSCSVVKSLYRTNVYVELHELGHSIGFRHDPNMNCTFPYGFMGWKHSTFKDCYRRKLLKIIKHKSKKCLRQTNMKGRTLNTGT